MNNKNKPAKNNNLSLYREKLREKNEVLIIRAIQHIKSLGGEITFSSVSKVTYDLADAGKEEKGLTLPAISKSKVYRPLVERAQADATLTDNERKPKATNRCSIGDMQLSLHSLRVEKAKLKMENETLRQKLKEVKIPIQEVTDIEDSIIKKSKTIKTVAKSMVDRLLELDLAYIDTKTYSLRVAMYDDILVNKDALELFYKKELDGLQYTICK